MAAVGYEGFSLDEVASDVGVTKAAIYRYFTSKRELAHAVVVEDLPDLDRYYDELVVDAETLADRFRALVKACMRMSEEHPQPSLNYFQIGRLAHDVPELAPVFRKRSAIVRSRIAALVDEAVTSGELDPDADTAAITETVAGLLWAMTSGASQVIDERTRQQTALAVEMVLRPAPWDLPQARKGSRRGGRPGPRTT
jgi:AcrR family transcriptional regulator